MTYSIFSVFDTQKDVKTFIGTEVTTGLWSGDTGSLSTIASSSEQFAASGEFFCDVYNGTPDTSDIQFSVAYGHRLGLGAPTLNNKNDSTLPTKVTYAQYRNLLLNKNETQFTFGSIQSDDIYVINIQRARLRQVLDPGNWQLSLKGTTATRTFIDNSGYGTSTTENLTANTVYDIRSGSISGGVVSSDTTVYGRVWPDAGIIILHPGAIRAAIGMSGDQNTSGLRASTQDPFSPCTGSNCSSGTYQYQHEGLLRAIRNAMTSGFPFLARSAEAISSTNYFIRLRNDEYNYSNNPTYYSSSANLRTPLPAFKDKPTTYPTTIGLYNNTNELLAIAKLSRPIQKSIDKEALIRVRLDF